LAWVTNKLKNAKNNGDHYFCSFYLTGPLSKVTPGEEKSDLVRAGEVRSDQMRSGQVLHPTN